MQMQHNEYKWDILRYVLRLCDKPTVLNMMNTCRYFNHEGAKDLLALHGPCRIFSAESFVSFFHFFRFKEGAERSHHLHSLELYLPSSPDMAAALRVFLVALGPQSRLKEIEISDLEKLCQADAQLIYALAALKSLTSIKLKQAAQYSLHFFDISQSSLVNVDMVLDLKYPSRFSIDIIDLFRRFYHSLETLRAKCSGKLRANARSQNVVYPHMQSLDLDCQDEPRLSDYLVTFPDLTSLHLPGDSARYFRDDELEKARSYNITLQRVKGTWTDPMGYFGGGVQMMYAFALQVCVNTLSICDTDAGDNGMLESLPRFLRAVLDGACPSSLYYDARYPAIILDPAFFSAFTVKRDPPIETLSFEISVDNGIRTSILDKWLIVLGLLVAELALIEFRLDIVICGEVLDDLDDGDEDDDDDDDDMSVDPHGNYDLDIDEYARKLRISCPTLRQVSLYVALGDDVKRTTWKEEDEYNILQDRFSNLGLSSRNTRNGGRHSKT